MVRLEARRRRRARRRRKRPQLSYILEPCAADL